MEKSLLFILYFQWHCNSEEACKHYTIEKFGWIFFPLLDICLHAKNQCHPAISSGYICDQKILHFESLSSYNSRKIISPDIGICAVK